MKISAFTWREAKLKWVIEKQSYSVYNWMKVIFNEQSWTCISQGDDAGTFVRYHSNQTSKNVCLSERSKFAHFVVKNINISVSVYF